MLRTSGAGESIGISDELTDTRARCTSSPAAHTIDLDNHTPQQLAKLHDAFIRASENPIPECPRNKIFFPIEINPKLTLVARRVLPIVVQPSNAPAGTGR